MREEIEQLSWRVATKLHRISNKLIFYLLTQLCYAHVQNECTKLGVFLKLMGKVSFGHKN